MKLSEKFAVKITEYVRKTLPDKSEDDLSIVKYGIEVIFMNITKIPVILGIGYFLNVLKQVIYVIVIFGLIRNCAAGIHARTSYKCLLSTCFIVFGIVYASMIFKINLIMKILIFLIAFMVYLKYSPADTEEKPYLNLHLRKNLRIKSLIVALIYFIMSLTCKSIFISNIVLHALWVEAILILPITYKIFKRRYKNYESYYKDV